MESYIGRISFCCRNWRPLLIFAVGLAPLLLLNALLCTAFGVWHDFWVEYIIGNYQFVQSGGPIATQISQFSDWALSIPDITALVVTLLAILAAYAYQTMRREPMADQALFLRLGAVSGIVTVAGTALLHPNGSGLGRPRRYLPLRCCRGPFSCCTRT